MGIQVVFRVQCEGACGGWLRKGRTTPRHWGEQYAEVFPSREAAQEGMDSSGWVNGVCQKDSTPVT